MNKRQLKKQQKLKVVAELRELGLSNKEIKKELSSPTKLQSTHLASPIIKELQSIYSSINEIIPLIDKYVHTAESVKREFDDRYGIDITDYPEWSIDQLDELRNAIDNEIYHTGDRLYDNYQKVTGETHRDCMRRLVSSAMRKYKRATAAAAHVINRYKDEILDSYYEYNDRKTSQVMNKRGIAHNAPQSLSPISSKRTGGIIT